MWGQLSIYKFCAKPSKFPRHLLLNVDLVNIWCFVDLLHKHKAKWKCHGMLLDDLWKDLLCVSQQLYQIDLPLIWFIAVTFTVFSALVIHLSLWCVFTLSARLWALGWCTILHIAFIWGASLASNQTLSGFLSSGTHWLVFDLCVVFSTFLCRQQLECCFLEPFTCYFSQFFWYIIKQNKNAFQ